MRQQLGCAPCVILTMLFAIGPVCWGVTIPGTACSITPPDGWRTAPGSQGSVINFNAPDGQATISVNVALVQDGFTPAQFMEMILSSVAESMQQDADSGWKCTLDQTVTSHGMPVTIRKYHPSKTPAIGDLIMTFSQGSTSVFMLNIAVAAHMRQKYEPVALACAKSIKDPKVPETPVTGPGTASGTTSRPTPRGNLSEIGELKQYSLEQLYDVEKLMMQDVQKNPKDAQNLGYLATLRAGIAVKLHQKGEVARAVDYLTNAVNIDGTFVDLLELLGDMLDDLAEPSAPYLAQSYYEDALALDPSLTACRTKLASSYMSKSEFSDARVHYEYLTAHSGDKPVDTHIQSLVLCYVSLGCEEEGIAFLKKMKEIGGGPQIHIALAVLLNQTGSTEEAVTVLKQVASLGNAQMTQYAQTLMTEFTSAKGGN